MGDNSGWPWPESLDAVVAALEHHAVLLENERVRVLEARVERNDSVPVHTHRWPGVQYILSFADFVRRDAAGEVLIDSRGTDMSREKPLVLWSEPIPPHARERGDRVTHAIALS
jgi:hypothetical protein